MSTAYVSLVFRPPTPTLMDAPGAFSDCLILRQPAKRAICR